MNEQPYSGLPYQAWEQETFNRKIYAANAFGFHLFFYPRQRAFNAIPQDISPEAKALAEQAVDNALWAFMYFLDGFYGKFPIDESFSASYQLHMQIHDGEDNIIETIELAPDGPELAYGFAGWIKGDFGEET